MKQEYKAKQEYNVKQEYKAKMISLFLLLGLYVLAQTHHLNHNLKKSSGSNTHLEVSESLGQRSFEVGARFSLADNKSTRHAKVASGERLRH